MTVETNRLAAEAAREPASNWKRWGPYLAERQWGTVREDYSSEGRPWDFFPHDDAIWRAYRWGEDGILGISDRQCRLCFAIALWNGKDAILKERLFGLSGPEGNHGEDVKECYFYLDSTPTHSYMKGLYKYPQAEFPYAKLRQENSQRGRHEREYELIDTGIFDENRYFDVQVEYAKRSPDDILIRITVNNRGPEAAPLHVLPTLWFRNTWSWGTNYEATIAKPIIRKRDASSIVAAHETLGTMSLTANAVDNRPVQWLFTENETDPGRRRNAKSRRPSCKDAFHLAVASGNARVASPHGQGTKAAAHYKLDIPAEQEIILRLRLCASESGEAEGEIDPVEFDQVFAERIAEADQFYESIIDPKLNADEKLVFRQANAGLLWTKQFYQYSVDEWLKEGPVRYPVEGVGHRNTDWTHLFNRDVISMPDKWEYPWYAAWDLAFHALPLARVDAQFAKEQLVLLLREWYMAPNGQIPAYEFAFHDVNPPVHAWACWRIYQMTAAQGNPDREFLARVFQKLLLNFTWWVNRKDVRGKQVFAGGFLGLDNIGIFDRSRPLPTGGHLEQADGTAWMAFFCSSMLSIAFELADGNPAYEDMASKFFEHYVAIAEAMNSLDGKGLWDEEDGFYYDHIHMHGHGTPLKIRSIVGIIPLFTVDVLYDRVIDKLPGFRKRMDWFLRNRPDLHNFMTYMEHQESGEGLRLLAIPTRERLERILYYLLSEDEFLSPYGIRSLSKYHQDNPYLFGVNGDQLRVQYVPGESDTPMFGGNSNWRGPIWFPLNYLLIEALERYHQFYGESLRVECPSGSGVYMNMQQVADEIRLRLARLFLKDESGSRPCYVRGERFVDDPPWRDLVLFYEYFHGDSGRGLGASHQTGWTALIASLLQQMAATRTQQEA
ncbi:MAG: glucosidase [Planctomycetaceae bacterium]|nr:glucosidase [Planctomycetaceae bacterium]